MSNQRYIAAIYFGHDSTISVFDKETKDIRIIELDKLLNTKHFKPHSDNYVTASIAYENYFQEHYSPNSFETVLIKQNILNKYNKQGYPKLEDNQFKWLKKYTNSFFLSEVPISKILKYQHHVIHAWSSYLQSSFDKACVITWDASGDYATNSFTTFENQKQTSHKTNSTLYGYLYEYVCRACSSLIDTKSNLDYAGKLMGLSAYGKYSSFTNHFHEYLDTILRSHDEYLKLPANKNDPHYPGKMDYRVFAYAKIFEYIGGKAILNNDLSLYDRNVISKTIKMHRPLYTKEDNSFVKYNRHFLYGSEEMDYAWAIQNWLENKLLEMINDKKNIIEAHDNNLILSGGVALNVLANQKARETFKNINFYVSPNPNDCGISLGVLAKYLAENDNINFKNYTTLLYSGMELEGNINDYPHKIITFSELIKLIKDENIIGLLQGQCEIGPRALGNRSIICLPNRGMKEKINQNVKFREWFRPFAPVCTPEMANKYFISNSFENMESMSYAVKVNPKYKEELYATTHVDDTARLQVVNEKDNVFLYKIINTLNTPLLNTSFNLQGSTTLNSFNSAFNILHNTKLDYVVYWDGKTIYCSKTK